MGDESWVNLKKIIWFLLGFNEMSTSAHKGHFSNPTSHWQFETNILLGIDLHRKIMFANSTHMGLGINLQNCIRALQNSQGLYKAHLYRSFMKPLGALHRPLCKGLSKASIWAL